MPNGNGRKFAENALLGLLVILLTPIVSGLIGGVLPVIAAPILLGVSIAGIISAGLVASVVAMGLDRVKALN